MDPHPPSQRNSNTPRPNTSRQRSNSFPIVEALGCSTPEAQLILAEGRAAVRKRRARSRRNLSANDDHITTFDPRQHLMYLDHGRSQNQSMLPPAKPSHSRLPSNATDRSTSTVVPDSSTADGRTEPLPKSPLGDYSANLSQFIKAQLKSIPTYTQNINATSPLSPQSCPDFTFPRRGPSQSSDQSTRSRFEAPRVIEIPPIKPPARSAFSAWSSTDDEGEDEALDYAASPKLFLSKVSTQTPSILGYYEHNNSSFLLSSTPLDEEEEPDTAKTVTFPKTKDQSGLSHSTSEHLTDDDYPSSCPSQPQLSISSAPSCSSSASIASASYFDCRRPMPLGTDLKDRIVAALTPPIPHKNIITATSPWEGAAIANVHDVYVESQQRVHVDGMSFDMVRDFVAPNRLSTPC